MKSGIGHLFAIFSLVFGFANTGHAQGLNNFSKRFVSPSEIKKSDWSNPSEMARSWQAAVVRVPTGKGRSKKLKSSRLSIWKPSSGKKIPAVIYMHGCAGVWGGTHDRVKLMANLGFLVVAPASFAREKYVQSCDPKTRTGGMFRNVLRMRQYDAAFAVQQVRSLPFVDQSSVILMGLSEGGIVTATYKSRSEKTKVTHRIIEGWTCNAGWPEYDGLNAGSSEPVLSLVGVNDPWFQTKWTRGHCGPVMNRSNGSASVVFKSGKLARKHGLLEHRSAQKALRQFLQTHQLIQ
jgi:dienelactone hydrolase